jgi:hypothetical protein
MICILLEILVCTGTGKAIKKYTNSNNPLPLGLKKITEPVVTKNLFLIQRHLIPVPIYICM